MNVDVLTVDGLTMFLTERGTLKSNMYSNGDIVSSFSSDKYDLNSIVKADNSLDALKGHLESIFELKYKVKI